ncbi:MAG: efflux RND transporter permease subunit [Bacteroidetes bacterium]|nr:efflux RND transporter permease subunit [Bacteroidota bacterium]
MSKVENTEDKKAVREFKPTTLALKNKNTVYLAVFILLTFGIISYFTMPKELFPEINFPTVFVQSIYPGNSPEDIENLITRPLENELQSVQGINELRSSSMQDFSMIFVEFQTNVDIKEALVDVKDAIDRSKSELPDDMLADPQAVDLDFSSFPILNVNLSGDYSLIQLKEYAEFLQDAMERVYEISQVNISGVDERAIRIEIDLPRMEMLGLSFQAIENTLRMENITMAGGELSIGGTRRSVRTVGEFKTIDDIRNIIIKQDPTHIVYLRDVAEVIDGFEDKKSYARLDGKPVVTLQVIKKDGENLITASESVMQIIVDAYADGYVPSDLDVNYTFDQSKDTKEQLSNLENSIIIGVILVITVLFFFLGLRNAVIVGLAIPMSIFITFVILNIQDAQVNMIVLFSLILALGMLVDNGIVVVENITRYRERGYPKFEAARLAVGEIAMPVISSTLTTLAAFFPLMFWEGMMGEFMKYMPITLIVVLTSSLLVALVFIPVFINTFDREGKKAKGAPRKKLLIVASSMAVVAILFYFMKIIWVANILALIAIIISTHQLFMNRIAIWFQKHFLSTLERWYQRLMTFSLRGKNPIWFLLGMFILFFLSMAFYGYRSGNILLFPEREPGEILVHAELPLGTDIQVTDSVARFMEKRVVELIGDDMDIVESMLTTVGNGARRMDEMATGETPHKAMVQLNFVDFIHRGGINTRDIQKRVSDGLIRQYPGIDFFVEVMDEGPPTGSPVNIEIIGEEFDVLLGLADTLINKIENSAIKGIEGLKTNVELGKPELLVEIDRDKAQRYGLSTLTIASTIRTALFGKEVSNFKVGEEEYPIQIRLADEYRTNISSLMNQKITFLNQATMMPAQIPISAVADFKYGTTYGSVSRIDMERVVTVYSGLLAGYNTTRVNQQLNQLLRDQQMPDGYTFRFTGEAEEAESTSMFMMQALLLVISLMMIILVTQFNSFIKPVIIIASVFFSIIGVFGGLASFKMDFVIMMTGIGIIALAGVVVNNAIVMVDYLGLLKRKKREELGLGQKDLLTPDVAVNCVIEGGKTRLRPVLLTAVTTILGLLPMAIGFNINFATLFTELKPNIYFGGDNALYWGPLSSTVIFGLAFATIVTLVIIPVMYVIAQRTRAKRIRARH